MSTVAALLVAALLLAGCASHLVPAPGAQVVPGPGPGATARQAGVTVSAHMDAWRAWPPTLDTVVTPVLVTIDNGGAVPLRVRREDFGLLRADGVRLGALGPYDAEGTAVAPAPTGLAYPRIVFGFGTPGWGWGRGDPFFYDDYYYPLQVRVPLPTADMVQMALPEHVVAPGERVSGFLYFERRLDGAERVDFTARLVDARTGEAVATAVIPFVRE